MKKMISRAVELFSVHDRSKRTKLYVLIAAVAIIECLILISFTTFSWIESASSLVIETGKKNYDDSVFTRIPIAGALNYMFVVGSEEADDNSVSDLNDYFRYAGQSSSQNLYRYSRASSANGKDFFFINSGKNSSNNDVTGLTNYRLGDYIDINSNYTYFDFTVANTDAAKTHKLKFYFADEEVFKVTNSDGSNLTGTQLNTIRDAMRISFQTGNGTPRIYSHESVTYNAVNGTDGGTASVTTTAIDANENQKLFTIGKNSSQNISVRIWLEEKAVGISNLTGAQLAGANITINLKLTYAQNDYDFLYFDDYTFSSGLNNKENIGGHLTRDYDETDNYRMYFAYYTGSGYKYFPMTADPNSPNGDCCSWVTCDNTGTAASTIPELDGAMYITALSGGTNTSSYFGYGVIDELTFNNSSHTSSGPTSELYKWYLSSAVNAETEMRFRGYSVTNTGSGAANSFGAGDWACNIALSLVMFRDLATCNTENAYNTGNNFKYITAEVGTQTDPDNPVYPDASDPGYESNPLVTGHRHNVMYVNTITANNGSTFTNDNAKITATMYYDKGADGGNGLFMSWVPESWLSDPNLTFRYSSNGYYSNRTSIKWVAGAATKPANASDYIYTSLGYSGYAQLSYYDVNNYSLCADGAGCWNAVESDPVFFSTELIDNSVTSAYKYQIAVKINNSNSYTYYNLIPDDTNSMFYAYIPVPGTNEIPETDYDNGEICFRSYESYSGTVNGQWFGRVRNGSRVYYPVLINTDAADSSAPKGYWNIAVIVDGTYEHFFWDYRNPLDSSDDSVLGTFEYNTTGHLENSTYDSITLNKIDEYRWYVPFDETTIGASMPESVYFKWVPYVGKDDTAGTADDTVFLYSHYRSDGIYCVITESPDNTPANAFS